RGEAQVVDQGLLGELGVDAVRAAGQPIEHGAAERARVPKAAADPLLEFIPTRGQASDASLALVPVARWQVEQHLHEPRGLQAGLQLFHRMRVRKGVFDAGEARLLRSGKALEKG